jgi:PAS domain S-box-containing protein
MRDRRKVHISVTSPKVRSRSKRNQSQMTGEGEAPLTNRAPISVTALEGRLLEIQAQLRQSEQELADAQQLATLGTWSWDINTGLMTWSDELYRIFGLHPRQIEASFAAALERVHANDRDAMLTRVERCIRMRQRYNARNRIVRPNGELRTVRVLGSVVSDEYGTPVRMFGLCQDITEFEKTKEAQRAAERKYQQIIENAGEGIFQTTPEGYYLMANPALARMHGFASPRELIGSCRDISHEIYVDPSRREDFKRLIEEHGVVRDFEHQASRTDGRRVWVSVNARAVRDESGKIVYYEGTAQDITERKRAEQALRESEERYRELFENSKDALYVHDLDGMYTSVNRAAEKLSGYTRQELIGKPFTMFVSSECAAQLRRQWDRQGEGTSETTCEIEIITKQGRHVPVDISSRLIFSNGVAVGIQGCMRDVSERRQVQAAARTYSRRLIEAQEAERHRISRELHDQVGQILTAVKMNLRSLQLKCSTPEIVASIEDNMKVIDEAVDQVRDLSVDLRPSLLDDFGLVTAVRWYLDRQSRSSGLSAELVMRSLTEDDRFSSELETACFRIVQEAVTNVVRHACASNISVVLERTGRDLVVWISDNGNGFDLRVTRSAAATLGLRGMEERVQAFGGSITITSTPEIGTQVCAHFPIPYPQGRAYSTALSAAMS